VESETRKDGERSRGGSSSASILSVSVLVGVVALAFHGSAFFFLLTCAGAFVVLSVVTIYSWTARERRIQQRIHFERFGVESVSDVIGEPLQQEQERRRKIRFED
jgi:phosphatidylserine decarboxylase